MRPASYSSSCPGAARSGVPGIRRPLLSGHWPSSLVDQPSTDLRILRTTSDKHALAVSDLPRKAWLFSWECKKAAVIGKGVLHSSVLLKRRRSQRRARRRWASMPNRVSGYAPRPREMLASIMSRPRATPYVRRLGGIAFSWPQNVILPFVHHQRRNRAKRGVEKPASSASEVFQTADGSAAWRRREPETPA
jgi:hypothetical protein